MENSTFTYIMSSDYTYKKGKFIFNVMDMLFSSSKEQQSAGSQSVSLATEPFIKEK